MTGLLDTYKKELIPPLRPIGSGDIYLPKLKL
jgi:hypothetical protein